MIFLRSLILNVFLYSFTAVCSIVAMLSAIFWQSQLINIARLWSHGWLYFYKILCGVSGTTSGGGGTKLAPFNVAPEGPIKRRLALACCTDPPMPCTL
jgi:hypothetical protein